MSEQKQEVLSHELLAAIGDYGHAKYRHDNDIITLGAWEDLITAIKVWNRSAIAAKDARIAELESILRDALRCGFEGYNPGIGKTLREVAECAIASRQQAEYCGMKIVEDPNIAPGAMKLVQPATPSEDGGEVREFREVVEKAVGDYYYERANGTKTVAKILAQHSRIVAAKDAEIARLTSELLSMAKLNDENVRKKESALADLFEARKDREQSKPEGPAYQFQAREIGESDWAPCDHGWYLYCQKSPEHDTRVVEVAQPARQVVDDEDDYMPPGILEAAMYGDIVDTVEIAKAALAPAAVAVVPDEVRVNLDSLWADAAYLCARLEQDSMPADDVVKVIRDRIDAAKAALSLNRRAIPYEFIKRIESLLDLRAEFDPTYRPKTHPLNDDAKLLIELRALLGKS